LYLSAIVGLTVTFALFILHRHTCRSRIIPRQQKKRKKAAETGDQTNDGAGQTVTQNRNEAGMTNEETDAAGMTGGNRLLSQGDRTNYDEDLISQSGVTFMSVLSPGMRFSADSDEDDTTCDGTVPLQSPFLNKIFERIFRDYDRVTAFNRRFQRLDQDFQTKRSVNEALAALLVITEKVVSFPFENQLTMMMMLRHFQNCGHKLIILVGELLDTDYETLTVASNEAKIMKLLQQSLLHETEYN